MKMPNPDDFIKHASVAEHAAICAGLPQPGFDWKAALTKSVLDAAATYTPPSFLIGIDPAKASSTDAFALYHNEGEELKLIDFKMTNNLSKKKGKTWAELAVDKLTSIDETMLGEKVVSGKIETTFFNKQLFDQMFEDYADLKNAQWKALYQQQWAPDPFDEPMTVTGRTAYSLECPRPARRDISVPPMTKLERSHPTLAMQAIFTRLLTVSRQQRGPGYIMIRRTHGEWSKLPTYRTDNGARCPFGYLIPDEAYHPGLEEKRADHPQIMPALGLRAFTGSKKFRAFLREAQNELHDSLVNSAFFMEEFEAAARRFARRYKLKYHEEGMAAETWAV